MSIMLFNMSSVCIVIVYDSFGLLFLIKDRYACGSNTDSPLWVFGVAAMAVQFIMACNYLSIISQPRFLGNYPKPDMSLIILLSGTMCIWGTCLIPSRQVCHNMQTTALWVWTYIFYFAMIGCFFSTVTYTYWCFNGNVDNTPLLSSFSEEDIIIHDQTAVPTTLKSTSHPSFSSQSSNHREENGTPPPPADDAPPSALG